MRNAILSLLTVGAALMLAPNAWAQQPVSPAPPPAAPYGAPITFEQAKKAAAAAEAEAKKNNWAMAIAIVEPNGSLVYFFKMDGTQYGGINVAIDKATSAAFFRRPTAAFDAGIKAGNLYLMQLRGANAVPGGFPIVVDGKLIGGIGASGGSAEMDSQTSMAGINALK